MNNQQATELLEQLVRIPSVSGNENAAAQHLVDSMSSHGIRSWLDGAGNPTGRIGDSGPRIVLLGHIDTVPGVVPIRVVDGKLYGRGAVDAKGPLATFVAATARAASLGELACQVEIVGCVEEEVPSSRGAHFKSLDEAPDLCINGEPSGWDAVTLGYKGYLRASLEFARPMEHTAAAADSAGAVACRTYVEIEQAVAGYNRGRNLLYEQLLLHLGDIKVQSSGLREVATLDIRLRLPEQLGPDQALAFLRELAPDWHVTAEGGLAAHSTPRTGILPRLLGRAIARNGGRPRYLRKTGTSDLNVVGPKWDCPIVAYGPGDSSLDHTPDEHIVLDEYLASIRILTEFLCDANLANFAHKQQACATVP